MFDCNCGFWGLTDWHYINLRLLERVQKADFVHMVCLACVSKLCDLANADFVHWHHFKSKHLKGTQLAAMCIHTREKEGNSA